MNENGRSGAINPPPLRESADRLYRFVSESPRCTVDIAAEALGLDQREAGEAVRDLRELGLLSTAGTGGTEGTAGTCVADGACDADGARDADGAGATGAEPLVPHPVDFARVKVLNPLQRQVNRSQALVDELRSSLDQLELRTPRSQHAHCSLEVVHELSDVRRLITGFADECCDEALSSQPGGARVEEVLADSMDRTTRLLGRGVRMRTLYQHTARFSPATLSYVDRVTPSAPRCVRSRADFRAASYSTGRSASCRSRTTRKSRDRTGPPARRFRGGGLRPGLDHRFRSLSGGAQVRPGDRHVRDSARHYLAAHPGGIGQTNSPGRRHFLRNCQRHISHIMKSIGARNRLHAGYLLSKEPFGGH